MNRGNFLGQSNNDFPFDCETLDFIQQNQVLISALGQIAGDKLILSGCVRTGSTVAAGYVFMKTQRYPDGEVLRFEGGTIDAVNTTVYVSETSISVSAQGYSYPQAYYNRSLKCGFGDEQFLWADFKNVETNTALKLRCQNLESAVALLAPPPLGIVQTWAGQLSAIPSGYALCDGRALNQVGDYAALYSVLGNTHNTTRGQTTASGMFRIPDLRSMFVVGYSDLDDDYNAIGETGGRKEHILSKDEMPIHDHDLLAGSNGGGSEEINHPSQTIRATWYGHSDAKNDYSLGYVPNSPEPNAARSSNRGGGQAHENRPPYYALAYIMRLQ